MKKPTASAVRALLFLAAMAPALSAFPQPIVVDHTCTDVGSIPDYWIEQARTLTLHYAHTSHGSQLVTGAATLMAQDARFNAAIRDQSLPSIPGALCIFDGQETGTYITPDLYWESPAGLQLTRDVLNHNPSIGFSMWAWCGQVSYYDAAQIQGYLDAISGLEAEFPGVRFVYMTGHLDGTGEGGNLHRRNNQIRDYCRANNKVLFDFEDIERYDPGGNDYLDRGGGADGADGCAYDAGNWGDEWCAAHPESPLCADCGGADCCAHSRPLNCNLKGRAFWWLMARLAGWEGTGPTPTPTPSPGPFLDARASGASPAAGEPFSVSVSVQPLAQAFDAWGVIFAPGGALYSFILGSPGALAPGAVPLATNVPGLGAPYDGLLLDLPAIPEGARGAYRIVVGLVPAGVVPAGIGDAIPRYADQEDVTVR